MLVLVEGIGLAGGAVLHRERSGGDNHRRVPLQHLDLVALEGALVQGDMDVGLPGSEVDTGERRGIGRSGHVRAEGGGGLLGKEVRQDRGRIRRGSIGDESGGNGKAGIGQALLQRILEELLVHERAGR